MVGDTAERYEYDGQRLGISPDHADAMDQLVIVLRRLATPDEETQERRISEKAANLWRERASRIDVDRDEAVLLIPTTADGHELAYGLTARGEELIERGDGLLGDSLRETGRHLERAVRTVMGEPDGGDGIEHGSVRVEHRDP